MKISRRQLALSLIGSTVLSHLSRRCETIFELTYARRVQTFEEMVRAKPDLVDLNISYLRDWELEAQSLARSTHLVHGVLSRLETPVGEIVEIGSYKGNCLRELEKCFGSERCWGMDIYDYGAHPKKIIADIRGYSRKHAIALGWNQTSQWSSNPRSKMSAHVFLSENIVSGGYLVEDHRRWMPRDLRVRGFKVFYEDLNYTVFRKS